MKYETLGDIVLDALEEYKPTEGRFGKFKASIEHIIAKNSNKIILGSVLLGAGAGYYLFGELGNTSVAYIQTKPALMQQFLYRNFSEVMKAIGTAIGALSAYASSRLMTEGHMGKRFYYKIKDKDEKKIGKIGKIFRHPKALAGILTLALYHNNIVEFPKNIQILKTAAKAAKLDESLVAFYNQQLGSRILEGISIPAAFIGISTVFYMLKDIENRGKEFKHTLSDLVNIIRVNMKRYSSKNEKLYRLISLRETCVSKDGKSLVGKLIMKKDLYEGLNSVKGWIDEIKNREKDVGPTLLKNFNTGILIKQNFSKKDYAQFAFFELLYRIQRENPETAKNLLKMVKERTPRKKIDEHFLLTYAGEKFTGESKSEYWVLLAEDIIGFASEDKNIRQFQSSEGKVWVYTGSKLIGRSVVLKEYDFDFFERFLKQRFEYETLKRTEIKTEHPLAFMREGEKSIVLTTREGDTNLREYLKGKSRKDKKLAFKKTIEGGLLAQKLILERVRKEGNEFYADVTFAQVAHSTMIQVLNLEEQLLYRAFLGDERRRYRFGENIHLSELLDAVGEFRQNNYSPIITTVNHGDYFTTNLSEKYSRFDSKHIIADCLFDMAYMALDPVFLEFGREEKAELVFKALGKVADFTDEKKFIGTFDYLLLHNGLGLSASQQAHNEEENAAAILSETLEFSKGKNYERALLNYLKESNARPLLKII